MPYRYFYDCEFIEDGTTIDLVSIGVVDEHGREFYAISSQFDPDKAIPWVRRNVLDKLPSPGNAAWRSRDRLREDLLAFLVEPLTDRTLTELPAAHASVPRSGSRERSPAEPDTELELWAWYAAYDHVALAQLWGPMPALPRIIPRFTKDLRQLWDEVGRPALPTAEAARHDALVDARHNLARWQVMAGRPSVTRK
jgi:hypothetical protein